MKKYIVLIIFLICLGSICHAQTSPSFKIGGNPGFESALSSNTNIGNWYGTNGANGGFRYASAEMTGSYVGVVASYGYTNEQYLSVDVLADDINVVGSLTFDYRPKLFTPYSVQNTYPSGGFVTVTAYDASNVLITPATSTSTVKWMLFGFFINVDHQIEYFNSSAAVNATYNATLDLKNMAISVLNTGKTWSDVNKVRVTFSAESMFSTNPAKYYVDNFR
jgi:hypothetical protein